MLLRNVVSSTPILSETNCKQKSDVWIQIFFAVFRLWSPHFQHTVLTQSSIETKNEAKSTLYSVVDKTRKRKQILKRGKFQFWHQIYPLSKEYIHRSYTKFYTQARIAVHSTSSVTEKTGSKYLILEMVISNFCSFQVLATISLKNPHSIPCTTQIKHCVFCTQW